MNDLSRGCIRTFVVIAIFSCRVYGSEPIEAIISHSEYGRASSSDGAAEIGLYRTQVALPFALYSNHLGQWFSGLKWDETVFTLRANGQGERRLYRVSAPLELRPQSPRRWTTILSAEPALNVDERGFERRALQLEYAFKSQYEWRSNVTTEMGIIADRRFGSFTLYPTVGVLWQQNSRWFHQWTFPDFQSQWRRTKRLTFYGRATVMGGKWLYGPYENRSTVRYSGWDGAMGALYELNGPFDFRVEYGHSFSRKIEMPGINGSLSSSFFWMLSLESKLSRR